MKTFLPAVLALALAGCVNFGEQPDAPAVVYYVLEDAAPQATVLQAAAHAPVLQVLDTAANGFYEADPLVFSRAAGTRGQYQFARWAERPGKRFADLLRARLDRQGQWRVASAGGYVRGDFLLDTELVEFYHDASEAPGSLRVELRAELIDLRQRSLVGRRTFETRVSVASYDAAGAAAAASQAVARVLDELSVWLASAR